MKWFLLLQLTAFRALGFSSCGVQLPHSMQESSQTRDRTHNPAVAGGFLTTGPPGQSSSSSFHFPLPLPITIRLPSLKFPIFSSLTFRVFPLSHVLLFLKQDMNGEEETGNSQITVGPQTSFHPACPAQRGNNTDLQVFHAPAEWEATCL